MPCHRIFTTLFSLSFFFIQTMIFADEIITNIKDPNNNCDYLIVTPTEFVDGAVRLAKHRNDYPHDYVQKAHVVLLDSIYSEFTSSDTLQKHEIIWYGLKWMYENWQEPFDYVVLMGDDSIVVDTLDTTATSYGRMPSFIEEVQIISGRVRFYFSDDWYTTLGCDTPTTSMDELYGVPVVMGRIPCETDQHCDAYVNKVVAFDIHAPRGIWRNRALLCADDEFQGSGPDYISHWSATEKIANNSLTAYFNSKCYLTLFPKDSVGHKPEATNFFFNHINDGTLWTIFYGHGNNVALTDEYILTTDMISRFDNNTMPTIFLSFTSTNGSYHLPFNTSMCKQFLLKPEGGCLVYIASSSSSFASVNEQFGSEIFSALKTSPQWSIGSLLYSVKKKMMHRPRYSNYIALGDPALTPSKQTETLRLIVNDTNNTPTSVTCAVLKATPFPGDYHCTFSIQRMDTINNGVTNVIYKKDSVINTATDSFITSFEVPVPDAIDTQDLKFIAYVWDSISEGRADTIILSGVADVINNLSAMKNNVSLHLRDGRLMLNYVTNNNDYMTKIDLFNVRGQNIFTHRVLPNTSKVMINLLQKNIAPGHYIVRINTKRASFNKRLLFVK